MKKSSLVAAAAASAAAVSASSSSKFQFPRQDDNCGRTTNLDNSTPERTSSPSSSEKFAPRFDGLRFIETLVTAHR